MNIIDYAISIDKNVQIEIKLNFATYRMNVRTSNIKRNLPVHSRVLETEKKINLRYNCSLITLPLSSILIDVNGALIK
jgi:hypothetical protein